MTNEEKARELGSINSRQYRHNYGGNEFVFSNEECENSALEMAEWKDQQFKEYLEKKKIECIEARRPYGLYDKRRAYLESKERVIQQIINELFSKEETDCSDNDE